MDPLKAKFANQEITAANNSGARPGNTAQKPVDGRVATAPINQAQSEDLKDSDFANLVSQRFNSQWFLDTQAEIGKKKLTVLMMEYLIIHRNDQGLESYIDSVKNLNSGDKNKTLIDSVRKKLAINSDSPEDKQKLFEFLVTRIQIEGFFFHSFNGAFEDSIRENGLNPELVAWDDSELGF